MFNKLISKKMISELLCYIITISFIIYISIQIYKKDKSKTIILIILTIIIFNINELILLDIRKNIIGKFNNNNKNIFQTIFCKLNMFIHHYVFIFLIFSLFLYKFKDIIMYYVIGIIIYFTTKFLLKDKKINCIFFSLALNKIINCENEFTKNLKEQFYGIHHSIIYLLNVNDKKINYNIQYKIESLIKIILLIVFIYKLYTERKIIYKLYIEKKFINFYNGK
tara:strand:+ start:23717 stop:24385 length:669 start_codon:yes stop_codon:yes gene_type:complete